MEDKPKAKRGSGAMSPEQRQKASKKGGLSVPKEKRRFHKDKSLASIAGVKGGKLGSRKPRPVDPVMAYTELVSASDVGISAAKGSKNE